MQSYLLQIRLVANSLSKKNSKQTIPEILSLLEKTGLQGKFIYIKALIVSITSDPEIKESFKLQTLRDEINNLTQSNQAILFKKELTSMNLSTTQIKSLRLTPSGEYLFGTPPSQPTLLTSALLFDYLCEHPKERIDRTNCSNANIFSISWENPVSLDLSVPSIHTISEEIVGELGTSCVGSKDTFSALLSNIYGESMAEQQVGELIVLLIQCVERSTNDSSTVSEWDAEIIGTVLKPKCKNWSIIAKVMDLQGYEYKSLNAIILLIRIFQQIGDFPFNSFFKEEWNNGRAQGCIVQKLICIASQSTSEGQYLMKYICSLYNVGTQRGIKMVWEQQGFVEQIIAIGERANSNFDLIYNSIEIVLPILCKCKASAGRQRAVLALLRNNIQQYNIIQQLWKNNKLLLAQGLRDLYIENPSSIDDIINSIGIEKSGKILTQMKPISFALDIACLLVKKDGFNLDKWLTEQRKLRGSIFGKEIIQFIKDKHLLVKTVAPYKIDISIIEQLLATAVSCGYDKESIEIKKQCCYKTNQQQNISNKANEMFGDYFNKKFSVEQFVEEIQKAKLSNEQIDNDLFVLLIKTLFDEFKRIKDFPKEETPIQFGKLYGEIILKGVLKNCALIHLLRVILWAVRESPKSNFFCCGIYALKQFSSRLSEWPTYCVLLKDNKNVEAHEPELYKIICDNANNKFSNIMNLLQKLFINIKLPSLLDSKNVSIIKNIVSSRENTEGLNGEQLKEEIEKVFELLKPQPNHKKVLTEISLFVIALLNEKNQKECIQFVQEVESTTEHLFSFTIESINIFLKLREYDRQSASLFESLGSLLGLLTIGMNKPLRSNHLRPKILLTDQLTRENYDVMLEFIIHFLMASSNSTVFTPNNPWIQPLLQFVCETSLSPELCSHHESSNKLLNKLHISPEQYLTIHPIRIEEEDALNKLIKFAKDRSHGDESILNEYVEKRQPIPEKKLKQFLLCEKSLSFINLLSEHPLPVIPDYLICPSLPTFQWTMIITYSLDFSLQDISKTTNVSLNTIITTVTQLVQKDFAMETNLQKITEASNRVFNIAQKLLQYTCRSCLESKLWKYLCLFVSFSIKQKNITRTTEQMKEIVMTSLQPIIEMAVEIKLDELRKNAKRQLEQFIISITSERQEGMKNKESFVAKGFEYLNNAPKLPEELQIANGGVTNYQMEMYGIGVKKEIKNHLDDKLIELLKETLAFDVIEKFAQLLSLEMTEKSIHKLITKCIETQNKDYCYRSSQIIGFIINSHKSEKNIYTDILTQIFNEIIKSFEKNYKEEEFHPQIYLVLLEMIIEVLVEKTKDSTDNAILIQKVLKVLQILHPNQYPKFTCQWIELFSHRNVLYELSKPSEMKNQSLVVYFDLFMKYLQFIQPLLINKSTANKQIISATFICILVIRECFPTLVQLFALSFVSVIPYTALSLRLPILTVVSHDDTYTERFEPILKIIPSDYQLILKQKNPKAILTLVHKLSSVSIVLFLFTSDSLDVLKEMMISSTNNQRIELVNGIADLMRLQTTTEEMKKFLAGLIKINDQNLNEIILRVLVERSFGKYHQVGALNSLTSLTQKYSQLIDLAKRKSLVVAEKLSKLC
ncbi:CCR4-not transcription complex, putative [Entamoeba dispar SAW760]|uniref:CCR4-not transcription complex, putative n=1 Tax=Entamoeba dispar (strain ATCC PRA-260 / SAW760) TaxID=370354 RepID=B0E6T7_ENTDS|nr:CCR4-not transcription complex, putative [Entamoeba dispar SAW760]EDR29768.1 CCR4-not transcription complex, putative [Entamoeba dispar SAW760]|eukprot:EDR29768.1 CCR4-not transcription complex, putative [Entamoeba dispar SAW760]